MKKHISLWGSTLFFVTGILSTTGFANPVKLTYSSFFPPKHIQSIQKGIVLGALYPIEVNKGWRMGEVIEYLTKSTAIDYTSSFYVVMSHDKWNKISAGNQKIIEQINAEWTVKRQRVG